MQRVMFRQRYTSFELGLISCLFCTLPPSTTTKKAHAAMREFIAQTDRQTKNCLSGLFLLPLPYHDTLGLLLR